MKAVFGICSQLTVMEIIPLLCVVQFSVFRASHLFQSRFQDNVSSMGGSRNFRQVVGGGPDNDF